MYVQGTVALERALDQLHPFRAAQPKAVKEAWQLVVAKFPLWHAQQAEHRWLAGLVDLGTEYQLRTVKLKSNGRRGLSETTAKRQWTPASVPDLRASSLTQQSFIWQVEGKFIDVLMVLSVLTSVATEIDEFAVEWLSDRTAPTDAEHSDLPDVRVDLKFRLYVREPSAPTDRVGETLWPNPRPSIRAARSMATNQRTAIKCRRALSELPVIDPRQPWLHRDGIAWDFPRRRRAGHHLGRCHRHSGRR